MQGLASGGLTLAFLILPIVIVATRESLRAIPQGIREAAYALGATKWQVTRYHLIPYSAGGIMTTQVTSLPERISAEQAIAELRRLNEELEQMFYVYVVDKRGHLIGVLSMRDLILAKPATPISRIMRTGVRSVPATMDQEPPDRRARNRLRE